MKKFETRDWIFAIIIIMLVQFIVQAAAWLYGGNSGALGYLSFAGTAVSIILAVLAIIYSFLQSSSQEKASSNISAQVTKLIDVVDNIEVTEGTLQSTLNELEGVANKIDLTIKQQGKIHREVSDLSNLFRASKVNSEDTGFYEKPLEKGFNGLSLTLVFIYYSAKLKLTIDEAINELMIPMIEGEKLFQGNNADIFKAFIRGAYMNTYQLLNSVGYIEVNDDETLSLHGNFKLACEKYINSVQKGDRNASSIINSSIKKCENWSKASPEA
ncbi:hypothetical protein BT047_RS22220 [Vibrio parahaemolyticus]|nr:hypothetical protein [Vibrio parahaemolyticus]EHR1263677.1 hypothetical protein [Vibrio parahaemolyticus]EJG1655657.1 hypothetical protein [Vibrio parahaemolyticus]EKB1982679.1 hypothetical protein [Vibrio parahaemolyticus]EME0849498.1 hypothetical protein [Vibrio parahaemolyticus]